MGDKTKIEWTRSADGTAGATWNPITGCDYVSAGCANCYAARMSGRLASISGPAGRKYSRVVDERGRWTGTVKTHADALDVPMKWTRPRRIFVCSMSDLFHPAVPTEFIEDVFAVMAHARQHTFQVLTKRTERMAEFLNRGSREGWPLLNVQIGTSVENQAMAEERIPHLLTCKAAVRWVSAEPLLGPIDLRAFLGRACVTCNGSMSVPVAGGGAACGRCFRSPGGQGQDPDQISWLVVGGESGPHARPMHPDWARALRDQCLAAGVAFMFKQWGEWAPASQVSSARPITSAITIDGRTAPFIREEMVKAAPDVTAWEGLRRLGKKAAGRVLDGVLPNGYPD